MRASAFLYPWDVIGDPEAPERLVRLGIGRVTLASAYHSTRALTPRHPAHRIVTARHAAVLYPPDPARWEAHTLRPYAQEWVPTDDPGGAYAAAVRALTGAGIEVHSWVVLAHNSRLGEEFPHIAVRNAYGDRYPWAPCIARSDVRSYAVTLAAEAAVRPGTGTRGTELESCGWYGLAHLHAHDKISGVALGGAGHYLMSLCFCDACEDGYASLGADPSELRADVVRALEPLWSGAESPVRGGGSGSEGRGREAERAAIEALLGPDRAALFAGWRDRAARRLQREAVAAVREEAAAAGGEADFRVLLHADPAPHRTGANAGTVPEDVLGHADGVVAPCAPGLQGAAERADVLGPFAARPHPGGSTGTVLAANFSVVTGMGGSPHTLAEDAAHARELGATELRLYHAGLASDRDLEAAAKALTRLPPG